MIASSGWLGDSISILLNEFINQLRGPDDILTARKTADFHVPILKHINLDSLPNESDRHENRIVAMPPQCEMDTSFLQLPEQTIEWVRHVYGEHLGQDGGILLALNHSMAVRGRRSVERLVRDSFLAVGGFKP